MHSTAHDGFTLAHASALFGKLAALRTLPVITSVTSKNMTWMHAASLGGHLDVVAHLVGVKNELVDLCRPPPPSLQRYGTVQHPLT